MKTTSAAVAYTLLNGCNQTVLTAGWVPLTEVWMIDWVRLEELREEVGGDDFCDVVEIFLEEVDEVVDRLHPGKAASLEEDLHFLKGSALNLGFAAFAGLCQTGEIAARDGRGATVDVQAIKDCYQTSRAAFLSGVKDLGCNRGLSSVA